ncbi:MAG: NAD-dependent epimerase/dehydratase family protein [Proteobacteria bacterium]|nr:NAD-dependent epimerase/dehydratase family protein [Pseudomonadota bacterium]
MKGLVLVTGASGFIAKHIILQLLNAGYRVRGSLRSIKRSSEVAAAVLPYLDEKTDLARRLSFVELDLSRDEGWTDAMSGVGALMHTASPFPLAQPKNADDLIRPAVDGTLRALKAAHQAGVGRAVLTSSTVAVMYPPADLQRDPLDERDWTDIEHPCATPYVKSKTLAERAAWDFATREAHGLALTTINPVLVAGPPLDRHYSSSLAVIERIVKAVDPMLPRFWFPTVDVRDVALMHLRALERSAAIGERFLAGDEVLSFRDMALALKGELAGRRIPTMVAPDFLVRLVGLFDREARMISPSLGRIDRISADKARRLLGIDFIPAREAVVASGRFIAGMQAA